jgi:hypothetical protein
MCHDIDVHIALFASATSDIEVPDSLASLPAVFPARRKEKMHRKQALRYQCSFGSFSPTSFHAKFEH